MATAVRTHGLGKRYSVSRRPRARTLGEAAVDRLQRLRHPRARRAEDFWALRNVSMEVAEGEVVGIVGRNGAGKSTLLRILAGITEPTEGWAEVRGRVGALLEVGTGFHPELSGRDNIYLNGAILGMRRAEIARRYEEIVDFAEISDFIHVPVKRYSSGMYVRLAFAVAAHLDPEILLVDEVLSVGDQAFQEKCLGRIHEVTQSGRTVLFVSHNMASLLRLCERGILLDHGRPVAQGPIADTIDTYLSRRPDVHAAGALGDVRRDGTGRARFASVEVLGGESENVFAGGPATFRLTLAADRPLPARHVRVAVGINTVLGDRLATLLTSWDPAGPLEAGVIEDGTVVSCHVPELLLRPGRYLLNLYVDHANEVLDHVDNQVEFEVLPTDFFGTGELPSDAQGPLLLRHSWQLHEHPARHAVGVRRRQTGP
jgi:lipopolysaccharide transport system ATP-binding protein